MPASSRASRFRGIAPVIGRSRGDDTISAHQRSLRHRALSELLYRMMADDPQRYDVFMDEHGLLLESQDRNDAVMVAEQAGEQWVARWVLAEQDGVLVPRALHLEAATPQTPAGGITTNLLRELSPSSAVTAAATHQFAGTDEVIARWTVAQRHRHGPPPSTKTGRGRPPIPDGELAVVAEAYLQEVAKGPGVTRRVAETLGMVEDTVRDRIRMARQREFLTPTKRGRRGGSEGPALLAYRSDDETDGE